MNKEEKEAINQLKELVEYLKERKTEYTFQVYDFKCFEIILNLIDKLQKENEDMREELQMYVDTPINKLIVENEELKEEIKKQYKQYIKDHTEVIENLKKDSISKDIIRDKIEELEEELVQNYGTLGESLTTSEIKVLKELLGE